MKKTMFLLFALLYLCASSCSKTDSSVKYNDFYSYLSKKPINGTRLHKQKVLWRHWDVKVNPDYTAAEGEYKIVEQKYDAIVLENDYIAVTLLPGYGGRMISCYNKSTGHEQLYQNPVGTPFAFGAGSFYYDWLLVYGGLFPTFPEPEHGKTWLVPWKYEITENSSERVSVQMSYTDDKTYETGIPQKFNNKATGITCIVTYRLEKGSTTARMDISLVNNGDNKADYEYWTCITFAPGSTPGDTKTTADARIVSAQDNVIVDISPSGSGDYDKVVSMDKYDDFTEWEYQGILYAHPKMSHDWYGVLNRGNNEAFIRVADNSITKGLKMWTWGYEQSISVNEDNSFLTGARPYIELWSGVTDRFFKKQTLGPGESLSWSEFYYSTAGLDDFTYACENGALFVNTEKKNDKTVKEIKIFMTQPDKKYRLAVETDNNEIISHEFVQQSDKAESITVEVANDKNSTIRIYQNNKVQLVYDEGAS
ncbi:MAG: DUF5107 domain-containing protein [Spirochaetes bacterium]|nr:DUF5107 domain-containing protein [Spirochaetota bacterium]MBN2772243.1 DUF5107 domain-containing protein [Spirochaetota bacterium]